MSPHVVLPDYFVSPVPTVWAFADSGDAIEWTDHQCTALMLPHLQILCQALADQLKGLPPLTSILFAVDALSRGWTKELAQERFARLAFIAGMPGLKEGMQVEIVQWLSSLGSLDDQFRQGAQAHAAFLCEIFEQIPRDWLTQARETYLTLDFLQNLIGDGGTLIQTRFGERQAAARALTTLDFLSMNALDADSLRRRMRIGMSDLPESETVEIVERYPLAALVKQLAALNDELGSVARMAQSVSATLSLPRLPSDPDLLPIGGVSDVTNRGQPDRLLMSELALDSDLLIARIANGQALYLRREQPPQPEPKHRCMIVESSVRTWGKMRLFSAAFALGSCIAQERRGGEKVDVVTVAGDNAWLEDFSSRAGIEQFYERLHADVHPAEALMRLAQGKLLELEMDAPPILILSEATERDAEFRGLTVEFPKPHLLARVEQAGWIELFQRNSLGDTSLQRMQLSEAARPRELRKLGHDEVPLFLRQPTSPLRYAVHPLGLWVQAYDDSYEQGCWVLTHDRRAVLLDDRKLGGIEVGSVPSGRVLASHSPNRALWLLVIETSPHKSQASVHLLVEVRISSGVKVTELKPGDETAADVTYCFERGHLLRVGKNVTFLDSRTGVTLASVSRTMSHLGGDLFGSGLAVYVASRRGDSIKWEQLGAVPSRPGCAARLERGVPVVYAQDLSWMLSFDGSSRHPQNTLYSLTPPHPIAVVRVNCDATEMLVCLKGATSPGRDGRQMNQNDENLFKLSLREPKVTYVGKSTPGVINAFEISKHKFSYQIASVRTHLHSLSFQDGALHLHTNRNQIAVRVHDASGVRGLTCHVSRQRPESVKHYNLEKPIPRVAGIYSRWKLRPITLPKGRAWLDSRGLLHLRALDGSELSFVLSQGLVAGWHTSGAVFGPQYFTAHGAAFTNTPVEVIEWLIDFVKQNIGE